VALDLRGLGAVVVKHTNPCGAAEGLPGETLAEVYLRARATDPTSAFGGIVGLNREVDAATAERLAETFLEAVIAPAYSAAALEILGKKKNVRLMALSPWPEPAAVLSSAASRAVCSRSPGTPCRTTSRAPVWRPDARRRRTSGPAWIWHGAWPAREVQRHRLRPTGADPGRGGRADEPPGLGSHGGVQGEGVRS
jgi:hypothetical protein